ncbi:hypothetical protein ACP70R_008522 [Stipagrostis hirtigluma subsp. patula]
MNSLLGINQLLTEDPENNFLAGGGGVGCPGSGNSFGCLPARRTCTAHLEPTRLGHGVFFSAAALPALRRLGTPPPLDSRSSAFCRCGGRSNWQMR